MDLLSPEKFNSRIIMDENGTDIYSTVRSTEQIWTLIRIVTRISGFFSDTDTKMDTLGGYQIRM